jgi:hypothetical protein
MALSTANICDFGWKAHDLALKGIDDKSLQWAARLSGGISSRGVPRVIFRNSHQRASHEATLASIEIGRALPFSTGCS